MRGAIRPVGVPRLHHQLQEMRDELAELRREQEWQRRLGVLAALLPYSGPYGRGWSNYRPPRLPVQRPALTAGEKRVARAAPILAASRDRIAIPQQRQAPAIEARVALPPVETNTRTEPVRLADGRFGARTDIDNNRGGR